VIAVDTNILVYAHRRDASFHQAAARVMKDLAEGRPAWALPWACLHEFVGVVTHPRIYSPPSTRADARIAAICGSHGVRELWTADRDFSRFRGLTVRNPLV
jgi:predicted nucleic acid-binding protein